MQKQYNIELKLQILADLIEEKRTGFKQFEKYCTSILNDPEQDMVYGTTISDVYSKERDSYNDIMKEIEKRIDEFYDELRPIIKSEKD